ncbi:hypothetical protein KJ807_05515 [Patescibacteria group bacterium]|nr:hypothetical protein [Patescibacteria group bacterium]
MAEIKRCSEAKAKSLKRMGDAIKEQQAKNEESILKLFKMLESQMENTKRFMEGTKDELVKQKELMCVFGQQFHLVGQNLCRIIARLNALETHCFEENDNDAFAGLKPILNLDSLDIPPPETSDCDNSHNLSD